MSGAGRLIVIAAPSGGGKTTLVKTLLAHIDRIAFSVSFTTRAPRAGEVDGEAYRFVDEATFRDKIAKNDFLEWAEVHGRLYGTERAATDRALAGGADLLLDIDVQGAAQVYASGCPSYSIFILPPSYAVLKQRLEGRGSETPESIARRLKRAAEELREAERFDYLVLNDDAERASRELIAIVAGERAKRARRGDLLAAVRRSFPQ